uniref:Actin binding LIM protein 1 n=1 Tax=Oryzias melastigma TaxID=30732 RepID=A0A3B3CEX5_ORYME
MKQKVLHIQDGSQPRPMAEKHGVHCFRCRGSCKGEVLRVQSSYFHIRCFTCKVCGCDLAQSGFFIKNGEYLCPLDHQRLHGTLCNNCGEFVEGEMVTVLGKTYHPTCFVCSICKQPFPAGDCVTFRGKDCLCQRCVEPVSPPNQINYPNYCAGCGRDIKNGQALLALGGQWHIGCFKCTTCRKVLSGEYINKDGAPYCERDYHTQFGVKCESCQKFITGKVLEAGDRNFHPSCARCSRCGDVFTEGEEMFLLGSTIWHPHCKDACRNDDVFRPNRSSSESSCSRPGSCTPGSPGRTICAKVDNEVIDYRDLAAIPRVKAIFDIEHPDMISYKSANDRSDTFDKKETKQDRQSPAEVTWSVHSHVMFVAVSSWILLSPVLVCLFLISQKVLKYTNFFASLMWLLVNTFRVFICYFKVKLIRSNKCFCEINFSPEASCYYNTIMLLIFSSENVVLFCFLLILVPGKHL